MHLRLCMPCRIKWPILVMKYKEYWPILSVHNGTIMQAQWPINRQALHLLFGRHPRPKTYSQAAVTKSLDEIFAYYSLILWILRIKRVLYGKKCCLFWPDSEKKWDAFSTFAISLFEKESSISQSTIEILIILRQNNKLI